MRAAILICNCFRCYVCQQLEITTHKPKRNVLKITNEAIKRQRYRVSVNRMPSKDAIQMV